VRENGRKLVAELECRKGRLPTDEILVAGARRPDALERMNMEAASVECVPGGVRIDN
jgi:hypothetical protein